MKHAPDIVILGTLWLWLIPRKAGTAGDNLVFALNNTTSMTSAMHQFGFNAGQMGEVGAYAQPTPGGNVRQLYTWTEPIRR